MEEKEEVDNTEGKPGMVGLSLPSCSPKGRLPCPPHQWLLFPLPEAHTAAAATSHQPGHQEQA